MENQHQRPEGVLIDAALRRKRMSARKAAAAAGMSDARWRQIVNGYQSAGAGQVVPVIGPADTIARMAHVAGVTSADLRDAGRTDAADALDLLQTEPLNRDEVADAVRHLEAQLNRDLLRFTDYELLTELHARMVLMASRLQAAGDDVLTFVVDSEGDHVITSRPTARP